MIFYLNLKVEEFAEYN